MAMTLRNIGDLLHGHKDLAEAFIQQWEGSELRKIAVRLQGGQGLDTNLTRYTTFRVWLRTKTKGYETQSEDLATAIWETFEAVDVDVPEELAKAFPKPPDKPKKK